ncbi:MAG: hypothetical protein U0894_00575 [Pirellulales bacterium]
MLLDAVLVESARVEANDHIAGLDHRSFGDHFEDGDAAATGARLDLAAKFYVAGAFDFTLFQHDELVGAEGGVVDDGAIAGGDGFLLCEVPRAARDRAEEQNREEDVGQGTATAIVLAEGGSHLR